MWVIGSVIILFASYLVYNLTGGIIYGGNLIPLSHPSDVKWWHIMIVILLYLLGITFMWSGKIETVTLNKASNIIVKKRTNMGCRHKTDSRALSMLSDIKCVKSGHDGYAVNTVSFTIRADFKGETSIVILESHSKAKIIKQVSKHLRSKIIDDRKF